MSQVAPRAVPQGKHAAGVAVRKLASSWFLVGCDRMSMCGVCLGKACRNKMSYLRFLPLKNVVPRTPFGPSDTLIFGMPCLGIGTVQRVNTLRLTLRFRFNNWVHQIYKLE